MATIEEVLTFIHDFKTNKGAHANDTLDKLFSQGYCYYFAVILKEAFGGEIVWPKYHSHIVWHDTVDNICYDIWGVYKDYVETDLIPINVLSCKNLALFRHVDETTFTDEDSFKEQCLINEYEFSKGWPLSRYIDNSMLEFPITKVKGDTYEYDIKSATLKPIRSSGFDDFVKDNNLNPTYLGWIKR